MRTDWRFAMVTLGVVLGLCGCNDASETGAGGLGGQGGAGAGGNVGSGGDAGSGGNAAEVFAWQQIPLDANSPIARSAHGFVYHPTEQRTYVVGGQPAGPVPVADTWFYDSGVWTEVPIDGGDLDARKSMRVVYDSARNRLVTFGGIYGGLVVEPQFSDATRVFDGSSWANVTISGEMPSPRSAYAMTYDEERDRIVLFGGGDNANILGDTWEFDGTQWAQLFPSTTPSRRVHPQMVYDPVNKRSLLFGGIDPDPLNDLWAWDGTNWKEVTPDGASPSPRNRVAVAWDSKRNRMLLYGGSTTYPPFIDQGNTFADLWAHDGDSWTLLTSDQGPGLRVATQMVYEPSTDRVLLFGGSQDGSSSVHDMWSFAPATSN